MSQSKSSSGAKKIGRNKIKCLRYRNENRRLKNKLRRIRKSSGEEAAKEYEKNYRDRSRGKLDT